MAANTVGVNGIELKKVGGTRREVTIVSLEILCYNL